MISKPKQTKYLFTLYIYGMNPHSVQAVKNVKDFCEEHLQGYYELKIVDLSLKPELINECQIVAVPTLIKDLPLPVRKFIGSFSDSDKVKIGLEIQ